MTDKDTWHCDNCDWEGDESDIVKEIIFHGTPEEPAEYEWFCPSCHGRDGLQNLFESSVWCALCEDQIVDDPGDYCHACQHEIAEAKADAKQDR